MHLPLTLICSPALADENAYGFHGDMQTKYVPPAATALFHDQNTIEAAVPVKVPILANWIFLPFTIDNKLVFVHSREKIDGRGPTTFLEPL
jgi:hypothetical protein